MAQLSDIVDYRLKRIDRALTDVGGQHWQMREAMEALSAHDGPVATIARHSAALLAIDARLIDDAAGIRAMSDHLERIGNLLAAPAGTAAREQLQEHTASRSASSGWPEAEACAQSSLEISPYVSAPHFLLGSIYQYQRQGRDGDAAGRQFALASRYAEDAQTGATCALLAASAWAKAGEEALVREAAPTWCERFPGCAELWLLWARHGNESGLERAFTLAPELVLDSDVLKMPGAEPAAAAALRGGVEAAAKKQLQIVDRLRALRSSPGEKLPEPPPSNLPLPRLAWTAMILTRAPILVRHYLAELHPSHVPEPTRAKVAGKRFDVYGAYALGAVLGVVVALPVGGALLGLVGAGVACVCTILIVPMIALTINKSRDAEAQRSQSDYQQHYQQHLQRASQRRDMLNKLSTELAESQKLFADRLIPLSADRAPLQIGEIVLPNDRADDESGDPDVHDVLELCRRRLVSSLLTVRPQAERSRTQ